MHEFRVVDPASPAAQRALGHYFDEIGAAFGFEPGSAVTDAAAAYVPPQGAFVVSGTDEEPLACGAVQFLDADRGEIKRMWVAPAARGQGVAAALLAHLEDLIRAAGRTESLLDTNSTLTAAVGLYESRGYRRVPDYNGNTDADVWFAKSLGGPGGG
ncbi:GNAT family N-acetyltransferase [Nocardioides sp. GXQ0305]|uniref:GNAT family N-acetyltransferase n=1 Tax=Nocardioides sp. GXQ0305 TaxID=3423912 RepID=UPI003D7CC230